MFIFLVSDCISKCFRDILNFCQELFNFLFFFQVETNQTENHQGVINPDVFIVPAPPVRPLLPNRLSPLQHMTNEDGLRRLNPSDRPDLPIIKNISEYKCLRTLMRLSHEHSHHTVNDSTMVYGRNAPLKSRKDHWAKLKVLYKRIYDCAIEKNLSRKDAAEYLDREERKAGQDNEMTLTKYFFWLKDHDKARFNRKGMQGFRV